MVSQWKGLPASVFNFDVTDHAQVHWLGAAIGEVTCPAKYMRNASSIHFRRSVRLGAWLPWHRAALPAGTVAVGFACGLKNERALSGTCLRHFRRMK